MLEILRKHHCKHTDYIVIVIVIDGLSDAVRFEMSDHWDLL